MIKAIRFVLACILFSVAIEGAEAKAAGNATRQPSMLVLLRAGYFMPGEAAFRDIYGGGPVFGAEARFGRGNLNAWLEGGYFAKSGKLSETAEPTDVKIMSFEGGILWKFKAGKMTPYAGAGAGYYRFKETNVIGEAKQGKAGFCGIAGALIALGQRLVLDCRLKYSSCSMQPADFKFDAGGLTAGIGLGLRI